MSHCAARFALEENLQLGEKMQKFSS
jgi:hypothetical protein